MLCGKFMPFCFGLNVAVTSYIMATEISWNLRALRVLIINDHSHICWRQVMHDTQFWNMPRISCNFEICPTQRLFPAAINEVLKLLKCWSYEIVLYIDRAVYRLNTQPSTIPTPVLK